MATTIPCSVDTTPMAAEIKSVTNQVKGTTAAVVTMQSAVIAAEVKSAEKVWDGNVLTSPGYFISIGSLLKGHRIDSSCTIGEIYDVGTTSCFVYPDSIIIIDSAGNDVTKNYKITSKEGTLTILEPDQ